jgi:adenylate kinase family enzyme
MKSGGNNNDVILAQESILQGIDAPINLISKLVKRELSDKLFHNIVLDAYPKYYSQFLELRQMLCEIGFDDGSIAGVFLQVPEELAFQRISNRVVCSGCGCPWTKPISQCSICGGSCASREDDQINKIVVNRLQRHKEYLSFATYFEKHYQLLRISALLDKKVVLSQTLDWIEKIIATQDFSF